MHTAAIHIMETGTMERDDGSKSLRPSTPLDSLDIDGDYFVSYSWYGLKLENWEELLYKPVYFHKSQTDVAWIGGILANYYIDPQNADRVVLIIKNQLLFKGTKPPIKGWGRTFSRIRNASDLVELNKNKLCDSCYAELKKALKES